jgi:uncharacterized delta-60 repeat protein
MKRLGILVGLVSLFLLLVSLAAASPASHAHPGSLDRNFGTGGKVTTQLGSMADGAGAVAAQRDGKLVAAGFHVVSERRIDFALVRYLKNGQVDRRFGDHGHVFTDVGLGNVSANAVAIQPDGRILVAGGGFRSQGNVKRGFVLARYLQDGSLDQSFGKAGIVIADFSGGASARALALQPNGKILVAGTADDGTKMAFVVLRYLKNGAADNSFGSRGKAAVDFGGRDEAANTLLLQPNGKILAGGQTGGNGYNLSAEFALARLLPNGHLDTSFGTGGKVITQFGYSGGGGNPNYSMIEGLARQRDGRVIAAGLDGFEGDHEEDGNFGLMRFLPNGSPDVTFGQDGQVVTSFADGAYSYSRAEAVGLSSNGRIIAVGGAQDPQGGTDDFALAKYRQNGSLDRGFGRDGRLRTDFGGTYSAAPLRDNDYANGMAFARNGNIVAAGVGWEDSNTSRFALAQYLSGTPTCRVPNVLRETKRAAKRSLRARYCRLGRVSFEHSDLVKSGRVISQRPRAGTRHSAGTKVNLVVSKGKRR